MGKYLGTTGLAYLWGKIKSAFATKAEVAAIPTARIYMGSCSTAATTNPKVCTVESFPLDADGKPLVGTLISVKFSVTNTSTSTTPELNVNNTGAIRIWYNNAVLATAKSAYAGYAHRYINYMYDGTYWVFLGHSTDNNTTYSALTQAKIDAGTETTGRLISADLLRDNFYTEAEVNDLLGSKANSNDLATVATSGSYNDLDDTPTIPTVPSASTDIPQMDGTGAAGSASTYAKGDHVHPSDTSREARVTTVSHGTNDTTFALTPNVLHTWGTISSLTLTLASGSSTYVDGYWFKFTAGSSFTALTLPTGVDWVTEPDIEVGKTYEVMIVDGLASYVTDGIGDTVKAKTKLVNHGTSDTTYQLAPNEFHIWGEVASLTLTLKDEATGYVGGYWFRFTCGSTPTVLTLPSSVTWYYEDVEFEANHTYEVTIVEGKACYTDYTDSTSIATKTWVQSQRYAKDVEIVVASGSTLTCDVNKMYVFSGSVTTLAITLPTIESTNIFAQTLSIFLTTGSSPSITFSGGSGVTIMYLNDFDLENNTTYELNVLWNGSMWIVGHSPIVTI